MLKDGKKIPAERQCLPQLQDIVVAPADAAEVEEEAEDQDLNAEAAEVLGVEFDGSGFISMGSTMHLGWRCSYRQTEPELKTFASWRARWSKARKRWAGVQLLPPKVRRSVADQLALQSKWRVRRRMARI